MNRRVISLLVLVGMVGLPVLAGCEAKHKDEDKASIKIDTEGSEKSVKIEGDND